MDPSWTCMTNFDHSIDEDAEQRLKAGEVGFHAAFNFAGHVSYDAETDRYVEKVFRFHEHVDTVEARTLGCLMLEANERWGFE
jgi:hypothetical protein